MNEGERLWESIYEKASPESAGYGPWGSMVLGRQSRWIGASS